MNARCSEQDHRWESYDEFSPDNPRIKRTRYCLICGEHRSIIMTDRPIRITGRADVAPLTGDDTWKR
jgi:hypothetical protein